MFTNIHPIVIHFPIAFLTIYSIFELLRFRKLLNLPYWWQAKKILLIIGWLSSLVGAFTGLMYANWSIHGPRIFIMHWSFALATLLLSTIALIFYLKNKQSIILIILALLILICVTITGGLGGAMVRGTTFDPLMVPIFKLLGVY